MRRVTFLEVVLILTLIVGACAPAPAATEIPIEIPTQSVPVIRVRDTATAEVAVTEAPAETPTEASTSSAPGESSTAESTQTPIGTDSRVRISTSTSTGVSEPFLVDQVGRTLYLFTNDTQNTSTCTDECLTEWPPVVVTGVPTAGMGVNASLLGTITRDDDTMQATYNGWPLYYFSGDRAAGAKAGQGMENSWFMVSATGNPIQ